MNRSHLVLASAIVLAALTATVLPVGAGQQGATIDDTVTCNAATGEYDLVFTITNNFGDDGDVVVGTFEVDGVDEPIVFAPDPILANGGTSVATVSVPGTTTSFFLEVQVVYEQFTNDLSVETTLDGDCEPDPTTTTSTTLATTTTTTAPAARAVAATPAFTG